MTLESTAPTIIDRISEVSSKANPPTIQINRLPGHSLIRLNEPCMSPGDGTRKVYSTTVFAGGLGANWEPFEYKLYHVSEHIQRRIPSPRYSAPAPWYRPRMLAFAREHCRTCPHMLAASRAKTGDSPKACKAAIGRYDEAFIESDVGDQLAGYGRTLLTCMAGHPMPIEDPNDNYEAPTIWFGPHPVSYTLTIDPAMSTNTRHNFHVMDMKLHHLNYDGVNFGASRHTAALPNTWATGCVCWGNNNPDMPEITDRLQRAVFNLDLTNYNQFLAQMDRYMRFDSVALDQKGMAIIPENRILSVNGEVNAVLCASNHGEYKDAWRLLVASGAPSDELGVFLPLRQHSIILPDRVINGYITPIIPTIGRCWFVQSYMDENHYAHHGMLLGQIDPPAQLQ